jgi:hypothetical protein
MRFSSSKLALGVRFRLGIKPGKHTFQVRAKDGQGQTDASPATKKFKIPKRR